MKQNIQNANIQTEIGVDFFGYWVNTLEQSSGSVGGENVGTRHFTSSLGTRAIKIHHYPSKRDKEFVFDLGSGNNTGAQLSQNNLIDMVSGDTYLDIELECWGFVSSPQVWEEGYGRTKPVIPITETFETCSFR